MFLLAYHNNENRKLGRLKLGEIVLIIYENFLLPGTNKLQIHKQIT